ncbi:MAG: hypothetical protein PUB09_01175 [Firmicutes bacterium]|nr:hypothetical protein [Bacillota bacterium]
MAANGSDLIFDYADDSLFQAEERRVQNMIAMAKAGDEEMKSCFDQMSLERMLSAFEHINYVHAVLRK